MKLSIAFLSLVFSASAFAGTAKLPCENYALYSAIRVYKAAIGPGPVQGSDGIQYSAELTATRGDISNFLVTISDNNEDGEYWDVNYNVTVRVNSNKSCQTLSVKEVK